MDEVCQAPKEIEQGDWHENKMMKRIQPPVVFVVLHGFDFLFR
ncbi:hypothetical protein C943_02215 [Mariniradius saccharolyticus AK6]|uniref:Uncharacterized protein n=1 Tax=Mariniradius saccharolyticus AK6 TaxID=1239962 RepID=M7X237_9BACT|nr:hypothetical protein C943_02215 [Mariniradius saccharolyticus AK6]